MPWQRGSGTLSSQTSSTIAPMNDRLNPAPADPTGRPPAAEPADAALPRGLRLGGFEIQRVLARSASTVVYLATDHALAMPVALQEYLPARLVRRDAGLHLRAAEPWHEDVIARGRRAFIDEARMLAHCDHPALVRVTQLFEALGSAYRVMPVYTGQRLTELRGEMLGAPDETALRGLLDHLLGAIEAIHRSGQVHGGITPANILLLADDRPLLLGPGAASRELGSDLVDSLMASLELGSAPKPGDAPALAPPTGAALDLYMLADTLRFCITGEARSQASSLRPRDPLAEAIVREFAADARPHYSAALLGTLDAALSTFAEDRPLTAAQFRDWLERGVPGGPIRVAPVPKPATPATPATPGLPAARAPGTPAAAPPDSTQPMAAWPEPLAGLTGDPITPERPPWIPPPLPPQLQRAAMTQASHRRKLMAAGFTGLAALALVAAGVWWSIAPEIRMEPRGEPAATAQAEAVPQPQPPRTAPPPETATAPAAAAEPPVTAPALDPAPVLAANPPSAGANTSARPVRTTAAAVPSGGPRAACAGRTEFALYRCMLQQCQVKRWTAHAQCVKLRRDDRVD